MDMIYCTKCGTPNDVQRPECEKCGTALGYQPEGIQSTTPSQAANVGNTSSTIPPQASGGEERMSGHVPLCILSFLEPIIGIIIGVIFACGYKDKSRQTTSSAMIKWALISIGIRVVFLVIVLIVAGLSGGMN